MLGQKRSVKFLPVKVVGKGVERKLSHRQIYGLPPSVFQNKDSPDYKPNYGKKFTERQVKILNEEIPIEAVRLTEISIIMRKVESLGDEENLDIARMLYAFKTHKEEYQFNIAAEDAKRTLQDLTPWEIDWNK